MKITHKFVCKKCNYSTNIHCNYKKHLKTKKHNNHKLFQCDYCHKQYKSKSGLWKHKCKSKNRDIDKLLISQTTAIKEISNNITNITCNSHNTTNNIVNNTQNISINVFLNDYCNDAVNIKDFTDNIKISLKDVLKTQFMNYTNNMTNIIIRELQELPNKKQPIYSIDKKKGTFYVKDNNIWIKDNGNKIDNVITVVQNKHIIKLSEWDSQNPNWKNSETLSSQRQKMLENIIGYSENSEISHLNNEIKQNISDKILIKDAIIKI